MKAKGKIQHGAAKTAVPGSQDTSLIEARPDVPENTITEHEHATGEFGVPT